jgi:hypothetical protein
MKNFRIVAFIGICTFSIFVFIGFARGESLTFRKVPVSIIFKALQDPTALKALLQKRKKMLHDRLSALGVEEDIKNYYRPKIRDEIELDRYIHQIFYDNTGYIGIGYYVDSAGQLQFKKPPDTGFNQWFQLASDVGLVVGSKIENGVIYVIGPQGEIAPYTAISTAFPLEKLQKWSQPSQ